MQVLLLFLAFVFMSTGIASAQLVFDVKDRLNTPTVVFVPGVLGSRLLDQDGNAVWGDLTRSDPSLFYDGRNRLTSEPLDSVSIFGVTLRQHTYGSYLDSQLRNLATAENFLPFSYDWRSSTRESAQEFAEFICREADLGRPLVIVAHSMGGLLVKRWIMHSFKEGCGGQSLDIHRVIFVATPNLGAPKAVSALIHGMDLFGFSAVDAVISKGLNDYGLSFDSTYELLPFSSSYSIVQGTKERCFPPNGGTTRHRVLYKARDTGYYETLDIFSPTTLERLGVLDRIEKMLVRANRPDIDARMYLAEKLMNARSAICELAEFEPPRELLNKVLFFYGNLRTDDSVQPTTISQVIIGDERLDIPGSSSLVDDVLFPGRNLYVHTIQESGDGTVPTSIAADPMKQGSGEPRFGNSTHLGVLSHAGFRELAGAILNQNYTKEARVRFDDIGWDGFAFSNPPAAIATQAIRDSVSTEWDYISDLPDIEQVIVNGRIRLEALNQARLGDDFKVRTIGDQAEGYLYGSVWDASAWQYILEQREAKRPIDVYMYASEFPSAENWHIAGSIEGLEEQRTVEALTYAGGEFLARGDFVKARMIYSDTNTLLNDDPNLAGIIDPAAMVKLEAGSRLANLYAGKEPYQLSAFELINRTNDFIKMSEAVTFSADSQEAQRVIEILQTLSDVEPKSVIEESNIVDTLRDSF